MRKRDEPREAPYELLRKRTIRQKMSAGRAMGMDVPFSSFLTSSLIFSRSSGSVGSPLELGILVEGLLSEQMPGDAHFRWFEDRWFEATATRWEWLMVNFSTTICQLGVVQR